LKTWKEFTKVLKRWLTGPHVVQDLHNGAVVLNDPVIVQLFALNACRCHQSKFVPKNRSNVIIGRVINANGTHFSSSSEV